jgi:hypothetical protein
MGLWIERKVKPRLWKFRYTYFSPTRPILGLIKAKQYAIKVGKDTYRLVMKGRKLRKFPY